MLAHRARRVGLTLAGGALLALGTAAPTRADVVTDWNVHAVNALVGTAQQTPPVSTISLAIVHGAVYDAVNSIDGRYDPYLVKLRVPRSYSTDAAAATAAHHVLVGLVPAQQAALDQLYATSLAGVPPGAAKDGGVLVGQISAFAMLAARTGDGRFPPNPFRFDAPATHDDRSWPVGKWQPTLPAYVNDPNAWIKDVRPFLIQDPARYRSGGPNDLTSARYAREFEEVKTLGSATSTRRTADQTDMARFWAEGTLIWTRVARTMAAGRGLANADTARMFAMMYLTGADSAISCWQDKARWPFWRPITAIAQADQDGNGATVADPSWRPLINTPPYPDHPSGLACLSGGIAGSLADVFGDRTAFSATSVSSGTTRSFGSFSGAIDEIVDARVWSGLHFRKADEDGARIGRRIARYREANFFGRAHDARGEEVDPEE